MSTAAAGVVPAQVPFARTELPAESLQVFEFATGTEGWRAAHACRIAAVGGALRVEATGEDPYLHGPRLQAAGPLRLRLRLRCSGQGPGQVFWVTERAPQWAEQSSVRFALQHDGAWRWIEVYAEAVARLAEVDDTLDWRRLATGILRAAQQMQYPDGPLVGCLPDWFRLPAQERGGPSINPVTLVRVAAALAGAADDLAVVVGHGHRVAAPFPVSVTAGRAVVQARPGAVYQVLIDGGLRSITSVGRDVIALN